MVGLIPLFAVETLEPDLLDRLPAFKQRLEWFVAHRPDLTANVASHAHDAGRASGGCCRSSTADRLTRILKVHARRERVPLAVRHPRAVAIHRDHPYVLDVDGVEHRVDYEPAESTSGLFGGNSNWRGPIWFPVNYLLIEALQKFHHYFGDDFKVECPTGSGVLMTLQEVATELSRGSPASSCEDRRRPPPCRRRQRAVPERSALARLRAVPRVLPRRQRRRPRRQPPDRLDRPGREAAPAERPEKSAAGRRARVEDRGKGAQGSKPEVPRFADATVDGSLHAGAPGPP